MALQLGDKITFDIAFWHPFGVHGKESAEDILQRKRKEIEENNGWTLWSFQKRKTLEAWLKEINSVRNGSQDGTNTTRPVFAFCSDSKGATDPKGEVRYCTHYREVGGKELKSLPD